MHLRLPMPSALFVWQLQRQLRLCNVHCYTHGRAAPHTIQVRRGRLLPLLSARQLRTCVASSCWRSAAVVLVAASRSSLASSASSMAALMRRYTCICMGV